MGKWVETVCSNRCMEVRPLQTRKQRQAYSDAGKNWHFLQGKKYLNGLYLMPILQEGTDNVKFAVAFSQSR